MQSITKKNGTYYFRLRIPKDLKRYFSRSEFVKSTHTKKFSQAKGLVRGLLGKTEELFMVIRSKALDDSAVIKIVKEFVESTLELTYSPFDELISDPECYDMFNEIYSDALESAIYAVKTRKEVGGFHVMGLTAVSADYLCQSAGYVADEDSQHCKKLVHQLAVAKRDILHTLQDRLETGDSAYDAKVRVLKQQQQEALDKSDSLSGLIAAYCGAKGGVTGSGRKGKLTEKMDKIIECFQFESGKSDLLLSEINYDLTVKVGHRLAKYPCYRNSRYKGKTLQQIFEMGTAQDPSTSMVEEELYRLSGLFDFALSKLEGLRKNYAKGLAEVIVSKSKSKASAARDIFRPPDIQEIIRVLRYFKDRGAFEQNPHLPFITLIGLYSGARINDVERHGNLPV